MRLSILIAFVSVKCLAQLPVLPFAVPASGISAACPGSPGSYDFSQWATLKVELFACVGSTNVNNNALLQWFDQSGNNNTYKWDGTHGQALWKSTGTPAGGPCVDFGHSPSDTPNLQCTNNLAISQGFTIYIGAQENQTANGFAGDEHTFFDAVAGGRILYQDSPDGSPTWFAGTIVHPAATQQTNWMTWTFIFNGASSIIRTNGVQFATGNPGANALGQMILGTDSTFASEMWGKVMCVLVYQGAHNSVTNNAIETAIRTIGGW